MELLPDLRKVGEVGMIKKIVVILLFIGICVGCCACSPMTRVDDPVNTKIFSVVEIYDEGNVIVDNETGVMYWVSYGTYNAGTLTLLVDKAGNPKIFEGK